MKTTKKISVLQGIRQGKIGGGESYLLGLVENLDKTLFEPVVLSFTDGPMIETLRKMGVRTRIIYTERPFDVRVWRNVAQLIEHEGIDLVHAHGTRAMSNMFKAARWAKLPLIYTCHGWSFHRDQNSFVQKIRIMSEKYLTMKANVNICGAKANQDIAKKYFGNYNGEVIYNSIDHAKFNPFGVYKDLRAELGIGAHEIVISSIARFTLQKQPLKLIKSFAKVSKSISHARLLMVGDGEEKNEAKALIEKLQLGDKVILLPFRQDVPEILSCSDIFVLPSLWEVFSIGLLEAMSMGKAVIATNVDGTPEMIQDGYNGLLIDVNNLEEDLYNRIITLCSDPLLRKRLQEHAIASIYKKYNVAELTQKNEEIYKRLVPNH